MRIQLWSYNYAPEPTGIGPVSRTWAQAMNELGHEVSVVAAHPHYPEPVWGRHILPTRSDEDGIEVVRLPLWVGRKSALARMRQDASFSAALAASYPFLPRCDARVVVSPCFPALSCAIAAGKLDRKPWLLWIQDILPDGAIGTGLVDETSTTIRLSRKLESAAYRAADRIAVISDRFEANLLGKGVPSQRLCRIYNPATLPLASGPRESFAAEPTVLVMGNIGHSQGLDRVVREFQESERLAAIGARLLITGTGVAAEQVRNAIASDRVEMLGLVDDARLKELLATATVGLVAQAAELPEFNFPSKLMNYLASALPTVGFVAADSEVSGVLAATGAGLAIDNAAPGSLAGGLADLLESPVRLHEMSDAAHTFAAENLSPQALARAFEREIDEIAK